VQAARQGVCECVAAFRRKALQESGRVVVPLGNATLKAVRDEFRTQGWDAEYRLDNPDGPFLVIS
jgi:hypothetical protein